jgi:hypothetical protein
MRIASLIGGISSSNRETMTMRSKRAPGRRTWPTIASTRVRATSARSSAGASALTPSNGSATVRNRRSLAIRSAPSKARTTVAIRGTSPSTGVMTACNTASIPRSRSRPDPVAIAVPRSTGARAITSRSISGPPAVRTDPAGPAPMTPRLLAG